MKISKITFCAIVLLFVISLTYGQTERGNIMLGGSSNLGFNASSNKVTFEGNSQDNGKNTSFNLSPKAGYFIIDGLAIGASIPLSSTTFKDNDNNKSTSTSISFSPFARYYFGGNNIRPFVQGNIGVGSGKTEFDSSTFRSVESDTNLFSYGATGGIALFLNDKVSLDVGVGYSYSSSKLKGSNTIDIKNSTTNIGLNIGVVVIL